MEERAQTGRDEARPSPPCASPVRTKHRGRDGLRPVRNGRDEARPSLPCAILMRAKRWGRDGLYPVRIRAGEAEPPGTPAPRLENGW